MTKKNQPIGIFDSGIGGLTVLKEAMRILPGEDFIYFCDQAHVPYSSKKPDDLKIYINDAINTLIQKNVKAIVVACNTATSLFIENLRAKHPIPFIGMEPALKPAVKIKGKGDILILATPITFEQEKFWSLKDRLGFDEELIIFPAEKLAGMIEKGIINSYGERKHFPEIEEYLRESLGKIDLEKVSVVVLGCTHYLYIKDYLKKILPAHIEIIDGNVGTVKNLQHILESKKILNDSQEKCKREFYSSDPEMKDMEEIYEAILENYCD